VWYHANVALASCSERRSTPRLRMKSLRSTAERNPVSKPVSTGTARDPHNPPAPRAVQVSTIEEQSQWASLGWLGYALTQPSMCRLQDESVNGVVNRWRVIYGRGGSYLVARSAPLIKRGSGVYVGEGDRSRCTCHY
jgi:hypothetical protein